MTLLPSFGQHGYECKFVDIYGNLVVHGTVDDDFGQQWTDTAPSNVTHYPPVRGNLSYVRHCYPGSQSPCMDKPEVGQEFFNSLHFPCIPNDPTCTGSPEPGYMFNPCMTAEVLVEVTNDGEHYSGGKNFQGNQVLSTHQYINTPTPTIYAHYANTTVNRGSFAVYTFVRPEHFYTNPDIMFMETHFCNLPRYAEEAVREREQGYFLLKANEAAHVQFDFSHIPSSLAYNQHYRVGVYMIPSRCSVEECDSNSVRLPPQESVPCRKPHLLSQWFQDPTVPKNRKNNLTVYALDDLLFKVDVEIMYGMFMPYAPLFLNSTTVQIVSPERAKQTGPQSQFPTRTLSPYVSFVEQTIPMQYIFCVVYSVGMASSVSYPLNLPPLYQAYERGRALVMYNVSFSSPGISSLASVTASNVNPADIVPVHISDDVVPNIVSPNAIGASFWGAPATTTDQSKEMLDAYFESFQGAAVSGTNPFVYDFSSFTDVLLPYLPYFSNCDTFDKYIPFWMLTEAPECSLPPTHNKIWAYRTKYPALPNLDDTVAVGGARILGNPITDWCTRTLNCHYEENLHIPDSTSRFYEAPSGSLLFTIIQRPLNYTEFQGRATSGYPSPFDGGGKVVIDALMAETPDNFIQITADHSYGDSMNGCGTGCFPRVMVLSIYYYQINVREKRIIQGAVQGQSYDHNQLTKTYQLQLDYHGLGYMDLILAFAYSPLLYFFLNVLICISAVGLGFACWLVNRLTTTLQNPPELKIGRMLNLVVPSPVAGTILGLIPIFLLTTFGYIVVFGAYPNTALNLEGAPKAPAGVTSASSGSMSLFTPYFDNLFTVWYGNLGNAPSEVYYTNVRHGRMGSVFMIIAFCCFATGAKMFYPKEETKRERELARRRSDLAEKEDLWNPIRWKKFNLVLTSFMCGTICTMLVEHSYWSNFGNFQWTEITMITILSILAGYWVEYQLQDKLAAAPVNTAISFFGGIVTFGSSNFLNFLLCYYQGYTTSMLMRIYLDQILDFIIGNIMAVVDRFVDLLKSVLPKYLHGGFEKVESQERGKMREVEGVQESSDDNADSVEPLLENFADVCSDTWVTYYMPYCVYLFMQYRTSITIPINYGITETDMFIYMIFQVSIVIFQPLLDIFIHSQNELYHGWKIYEYLVYCRYRFLQRETRWKGMEDSLDECIEEGLRKLDQMCFSSQYFLMITIQTNGIIYVMFGYECWLHAGTQSAYSPFTDSGLPFLIFLLLLFYKLLEYAIMFLAVQFKVWRIKHENTAWHIQMGEEDDLEIPGWEDVKGASHEAYLMNQRITSDTFRYKFLNYNRSWLIQQLPQLLTPRTLRRSRPYLINQFARIINAKRDDISDDSGDDKDKKFGPVALSAASRSIIRWWLGKARRRLQLRTIVDPLIRRARGAECEQCLSRKQLHVEYDVDIDKMMGMYDNMYPGDTEIDQVQWKSFWMNNQRYHTICLACITKRKEVAAKNAIRGALDPVLYDDTQEEYPEWGPVYLSAASKAILLNWYRKAQRLRAGKKGSRRREKVIKNVSDDEGDEVPSEWARSVLAITPSTRAIATRWMRTARARLQQKAGKGSGVRESLAEDGNVGETFRSGKKSRQGKK